MRGHIKAGLTILLLITYLIAQAGGVSAARDNNAAPHSAKPSGVRSSAFKTEGTGLTHEYTEWRLQNSEEPVSLSYTITGGNVIITQHLSFTEDATLRITSGCLLLWGADAVFTGTIIIERSGALILAGGRVDGTVSVNSDVSPSEPSLEIESGFVKNVILSNGFVYADKKTASIGIIDATDGVISLNQGSAGSVHLTNNASLIIGETARVTALDVSCADIADTPSVTNMGRISAARLSSGSINTSGIISTLEITGGHVYTEAEEGTTPIINTVLTSGDEHSFDNITVITTITPVTESTTVRSSPHRFTFDGALVDMDAYLVNNTNYVKLTDIATVLISIGSEKAFDISFDISTRTVFLFTHANYTPSGGEMETKSIDTAVASVSNWALNINGKHMPTVAYNIDGDYFFKIRDIGIAVDFGIGYDDETKTVLIDTVSEYVYY